MAKKDKQPFQFGIKHLFRFIFFIFLFLFLINYFSKSKPQANIWPKNTNINLQQFTNYIPAHTLQKIENIPQTPLVLGVSHQIEGIKKQLNGFPGNLLNNLKKEIATYIYKSIIKDTND